MSLSVKNDYVSMSKKSRLTLVSIIVVLLSVTVVLIHNAKAAGGLTDTFMDTASTAIENHTGESGHTWTKNSAISGGIGIISNQDRARSNSTDTVIYNSSWSPSNADYDVSADIYIADTNLVDFVGISGRTGGSSFSGYYAVLGAGSKVSLYATGGAEVQKDVAVSTVAGQTYTMKLEMRGTRVKVYWNNVAIIDKVTSGATYVSQVGTPGIYLSGAASDVSQAHISSITADDAAVSVLSAGTLSTSARNSSSASLEWTPASGGTNPVTTQLQKSNGGTNTWSNVSGATTSPAVSTGLSPATAYDFRVAYSDATATTVYSNTISVVTANPPSGNILDDASLWFKADTLNNMNDGDGVSSWTDSSSTGKNATQSTTASQPKFFENAINGHSIVRFDGNNSLVIPSVSSAANITMFLVAKSNSSQASYVYEFGDGDANAIIENFDTGKWEYFNAPRTFLANSSQTSFQIISSRVGSANGGEHVIGSAHGLIAPWKGDLAEVIYFNKTLTNTEYDTVNDYLDAKYLQTEPSAPDAPTIGTASIGDSQASISFTPPQNDGQSDITSYTVTSTPGGATASGASSPIIVSGLTNGTPYTFKVTATNDIGTSVPSSASNSVTPNPISLPEQVTNLAANGVNRQVLLSWAKPSSEGSISDYVIEYKSTSSSTWQIFNDGLSTATKSIVTGLANTTSYDFRVKAVSIAGAGVNSTVISAAPKSISSLNFVFNGESNSGGQASNSTPTAEELAPTPQVQILNNSSLTFESLDVGTNNNIDHANLPPNVTHGFEIGLANATKAHVFPNNPQVNLIKTGQGGSTLSQWNVGGTYWTKFQQRTSAAKAVLPSDRQWVVWMSIGINDSIAGTTPANYKMQLTAHIAKVQADLPGAIVILTQFQSMGYPAFNTVMGEVADTEPNVFVVNSTGATLDDSNHWGYEGLKTVSLRMVNLTKDLLGLKYAEAPISLNAVSSSTVNLSWTPPASNGGTPITDYVVEYKPSTSSTWTIFNDGVNTNSSASISGLAVGVNYDFRVTAKTANGLGDASSVVSATQVGAPGAPTNLVTTRENLQSNLSWTPPASNGGTPITDYVVEYKPSTSSTWTIFNDGISSTTSTTVTGLSNGTVYNFRVSAINSYETGVSSNVISVTPGTTPSQPSISVTEVPAGAAVSWTQPTNGGYAISDYIVEYKLSTDNSWTTFNDGIRTTTGVTIKPLSIGSSYDFRIAAVNSIGIGTFSSLQSATPLDVETSVTVSGESIRGGLVISQRPTFSGTASPGSTIVVTVRSDPISCTAVANAIGDWSCTLPSSIPVGTHNVYISVTASGGGVAEQFGPYEVTVVGQTVTSSTPTQIGAPNTGERLMNSFNNQVMNIAGIVLGLGVAIFMFRYTRKSFR